MSQFTSVMESWLPGELIRLIWGLAGEGSGQVPGSGQSATRIQAGPVQTPTAGNSCAGFEDSSISWP